MRCPGSGYLSSMDVVGLWTIRRHGRETVCLPQKCLYIKYEPDEI